MKDRDPERLGNLLEPVTARLGLGGARKTGKVWSRWTEIVGPEIAAHAQPSSLKEGVLRVKVDSPAWATEISYLAAELRTKINRAVDSELVTEVKVWTGPGPLRRSDETTTTSDRKSSRRAVSNSTREPLEALEGARRAWFKRRSSEDREGR